MKAKLICLFFLILIISPGLSVYAAEQQPVDERAVATMDDQGIQHIEVTGGEYYFSPRTIVVKVNHPVEMMVKKAGGFIPHNIIVNAPEAGIEFNVGLGNDPQPINFTPSKTGTYQMYCDKRFLFFKNHQAKGMEGIIEVIE